MTTLGLDLSLASSGAAVFSPEGRMLHCESVVYKPEKADMTRSTSGKSAVLTNRQKVERLVFIRDRVQSISREYDVRHVAIEGYAYSIHSASVTGLAELGGAVRVGLYDAFRLVPMVLTVSACRRFVVGSGKVTKEETREWLKKNKLTFDTDDEADAFVVGLTGFYVAHPTARQALTVGQLEIIDGLTKAAKRRAPKRSE